MLSYLFKKNIWLNCICDFLVLRCVWFSLKNFFKDVVGSELCLILLSHASELCLVLRKSAVFMSFLFIPWVGL